MVGPSYAKQVYEKEFEAEAARLGHPVRLCKFAKNRLAGFEQHLELQHLLVGKRWPRLKLVYFDASLGPDSGYVEANAFKPRITAYHTAHLFPWYFRYWNAQESGPVAHARQLAGHLLHFVGNTLAVGRGAAGMVSLAEPPPPPKEQQPLSIRKHNAKLAQLKRDVAQRTHVTYPNERKRQILEEAELIRSQGYLGEALMAPTWVNVNAFGEEPLGEARVLFHDFADPKRYPTLYKHGTHKRDGHLTKSGAEEYSKLLARLTVERLKDAQ